MSGVQTPDRLRLDGCEIELFQLVKSGATPLEHAAADGNMELFARLMDAGTDGSAGCRGCHERTLLGAAAAGSKDGRMTSALVHAGATPDVNVLFGERATFNRTGCESALHVAANRGSELTSKALLSAGAFTNTLDHNLSPLHRAALSEEWGSVRVLSALLKHGSDVKARDDVGLTALHLAAGVTRNSGDKVRTLLEAGADIDAKSSPHHEYWWDDGEGICNFDVTPLHAAVHPNGVLTSALQILLEGGANVHAQTDGGLTALHIACYRSKAAAAEILLQRGGH